MSGSSDEEMEVGETTFNSSAARNHLHHTYQCIQTQLDDTSANGPDKLDQIEKSLKLVPDMSREMVDQTLGKYFWLDKEYLKIKTSLNWFLPDIRTRVVLLEKNHEIFLILRFTILLLEKSNFNWSVFSTEDFQEKLIKLKIFKVGMQKTRNCATKNRTTSAKCATQWQDY